MDRVKKVVCEKVPLGEKQLNSKNASVFEYTGHTIKYK